MIEIISVIRCVPVLEISDFEKRHQRQWTHIWLYISLYDFLLLIVDYILFGRSKLVRIRSVDIYFMYIIALPNKSRQAALALD